jgi:cytoskeleton protein RodZ
LRRERLSRGFELDTISRELKISARFLEAIEGNDFKKLPGGVFAKSFVRQYARMLGLDEEELAGEVQRIVEPEIVATHVSAERVAAPEIHLPRVEEWERAGDRRSWSSVLPALALVVVVMLVCSGVYAFWQRARHPAAAHQPSSAPAEAAHVASVEPPANPPAPLPADSAAQAPAAVPGSEPVAPPPQTQPQQVRPTESSADRPASETATPPAASAASQAPAGAIGSTQPRGEVRLELTAAEPVWVMAQANGKFLFSGTLDTNQTRTVEANGVVLLRLGNAGGLNITLNGKPIGTVGPKGQVRTVQFTSGGFQIVAASSPAPVSFDPLDRL